MNKFSKTIILLAFLACAYAVNAFTDPLPGDLDNAQPLYKAWEIKSGTTNPLCVYIGFGENEFLPEWKIVPPPVPDVKSDLLAIEVGESTYSTYSQEHGNDSLSHQWNICVYSEDGGDCQLNVTPVYGELAKGETLKLFAEDASTLLKDLSGVTVESPVAVKVAPGKYIIQYSPAPPVLVTGVTLDCHEATLIQGKDTLQLTATVAPADAADKRVSWGSSDSSIAKVSSTGLVTPVSGGTASITVATSDGGYFDACTITVVPAVYPVPQPITITLKVGWNLISMPFKTLTSAKINNADVAVEDVQIYAAVNGKYVQRTLKELSQGEAGWYHNSTNDDMQLDLRGECEPGQESKFPENASSGWKFVGLAGKYDVKNECLSPADDPLPIGTNQWDATKQIFVKTTEKTESPIFGVGYIKK